jgi:hypothetical protein
MVILTTPFEDGLVTIARIAMGIILLAHLTC